jgi:hypothetical protein
MIKKPNGLQRLILFLFGWIDSVGTAPDKAGQDKAGKLQDFINKYEKQP